MPSQKIAFDIGPNEVAVATALFHGMLKGVDRAQHAQGPGDPALERGLGTGATTTVAHLIPALITAHLTSGLGPIASSGLATLAGGLGGSVLPGLVNKGLQGLKEVTGSANPKFVRALAKIGTIKQAVVTPQELQQLVLKGLETWGKPSVTPAWQVSQAMPATHPGGSAGIDWLLGLGASSPHRVREYASIENALRAHPWRPGDVQSAVPAGGHLPAHPWSPGGIPARPDFRGSRGDLPLPGATLAMPPSQIPGATSGTGSMGCPSKPKKEKKPMPKPEPKEEKEKEAAAGTFLSKFMERWRKAANSGIETKLELFRKPQFDAAMLNRQKE